MHIPNHRPVQPVGGLFQVLALNATELDRQQHQQQARALFKPLGPAQPSPNVPAPLAYEPHPEAAAWQHNVAGFLRALHQPLDSRNPYNDHRFFSHAAVLSAGWSDAPADARFELAPGRTGMQWPTGLPYCKMITRRFALLLEYGTFDKRYPVLFDRDGLILDGLHRLRACAQTGCRFYFLQLNF